MADGFMQRLTHAWNAFIKPSKPEGEPYAGVFAPSYSMGVSRPDRPNLRFVQEKTIIASIYTRLSLDVCQNKIRHVRLDDNDRYLEEIDSRLNDCFSVSPNMDQVPLAFMQDLCLTLFDKGVAAIVPVDTTLNPNETGGYDILQLRVGYVTQWYPDRIRVSVYNEARGEREEVEILKSIVAIVENPYYSIMNEPNSTLQRLNRKLTLLDTVDEQTSSGKLDMIIQLPYVIKSDARRQQAEQRRTDIELQLKGSKYGIAYTDGTEKITQLNRPVENNLLKQVEYLTELLYSQLGLTPEILKGTADEQTMLNYYARTINPILDAIVESFHRTFLTRTARSQKQAIRFYRDPFLFVPMAQMAEIADKFTRNEIASSNDIRVAMHWKPSKDPRADELRNSNMPDDKQESSRDNEPDRKTAFAQQIFPQPKQLEPNGTSVPRDAQNISR